MPTRTACLLACLLLALTALAKPAAAQQQEQQQPQRPNIVFIFSDDHAYQAIGAYESYLHDVVRTPNIDSIAEQGMLFERCFVTNSICGPMRAVIQTGRYSHLNGFYRNGTNDFDGSQQSFPRLLQAAGYQTAIIGKWHLGDNQAPQGFNYSEVLIGQGPYYNPPMLLDANGTGDNSQRERVVHEGYVTDIITDRALNWLQDGRDTDQPFMLMLQNKAPHREWSPQPDIYATWRNVQIPEPPTLFENYDEQVEPRRHQQMTIANDFHAGQDDKRNNWAPGNLTDEQRTAYRAMFAEENAAFEAALPNMTEQERVQWVHQRYLRTYLACIESVDINVGRVLDYLQESGLAQNTVVIYCSDQGFYLGEHGWYDKRWVYQESLITPLIVRWPGVVEPGSRNGDIVSPLDFAQTFLEMAGAQEPEGMQGRSLVPVLAGHTPEDWRTGHYYHYYEYPGYHEVSRHYAVCTTRYKLICFYNPDNDEKVWELVDLEVDPLEQHNYYDDPAYAQVQAELHAQLDRLREQYQVPDEDPAFLNRGRNQH